MIDDLNKSLCNGCHACVSICPKNCIEMQIDEEGFWYPIIDYARCIKCQLCEKRCPVMNSEHDKCISLKKAFAAYNKESSIRGESSSGGVFTLLAEWVLNQEGIVFGARYNDDLQVVHNHADNIDDIGQFRGSKYVQSKIGSTLSEAKGFLENDKWVLFSGTPCQIGGLYSFLGKDYEKLITVDIVCHGVPSPLVFEKYKKFMSAKEGSKVEEVTFRDKQSGWKQYKVRLKLNNDIYIREKFRENLMMKAFLKDLCLRPSCYECSFKNTNRQSDITLADFWGIHNVAPDMDDDRGTSLVLVNSKKAEQIYNMLDVVSEETDFDKSITPNSAMYKSVKVPAKRQMFMSQVDEYNFENIVNECTKVSLLNKCKINILSLIRRVKNKIKKIVLKK